MLQFNNEFYHYSENSTHLESHIEGRSVGSRLSYTPPSNTASNSSRRSRADTMPSSTLPPFIGLGTTANLYSSINVAQQRPNQDRSLTTSNNEALSMFHSSGMSSPLDENASNSIASTLASLGLDDNNDTNNTDNDNNTHREYFEPLSRNRSATLASKSMEQSNNMMSFSPFASTRRPRAISLGMVDSPVFPNSGFSPFDLPFQQDYQRNTNNLTDNGLYQSRMFARMDSHEEEEDYHHNTSDDGGMESPAQTPSRALWLGNVNPSLSVPDLHKMFSRYGRVESARILSDKECAFVNFESADSALAAKEDLVNRLGSMVAGSVVKVGFGKADVNLAMALTNEAGPNAQGPTRALCK